MARGKTSKTSGALKRLTKSVDELTKKVSRGIPDSDKIEAQTYAEILFKKLAILKREISKRR